MCTVLFSCLLISIADGVLGEEPYYGVPVGSYDGGEVYAADARTLIIVNVQQPLSQKCTSFIGSIFGRASPQHRSKSNEALSRPKRQFPAMRELVPQIQALNPNQHPLDWPFEFGHLKVEDGGTAGAAGASKSQDPFDVELSRDEDDAGNGTQSPITVTADATSTVNVVTESDQFPREYPITRIRTILPPREEEDAQFGPSVDPHITLPPSPVLNSSIPQPSQPVEQATPDAQVGLNASWPPAPTTSSPVDAASSLPPSPTNAIPQPTVNTDDVNKSNNETLDTLSTPLDLPSSPTVATTTNGDVPAVVSPDPPPISDVQDGAILQLDESTPPTPPTPGRALWARPTAAKSEEVENGHLDATVIADEETTSASSPIDEVTESSTSSTLEITQTAQRPVETQKEKGARREKLPETGEDGDSINQDSPARRTGGIVWSDDKQDSQQQQLEWHRPEEPPQRPSSTNQEHLSGGIIWLGQGPPTTAPPAEKEQTISAKAKQRRGKNRRVSVLRQLPIEHFVGLNIPDELEGKATNETKRAHTRGSAPRGQQQNGDDEKSAYTIKLGGPTRSTVSPPTTQPVQESFRGLPPAPPAAPAAAPPGNRAEAEVETGNIAKAEVDQAPSAAGNSSGSPEPPGTGNVNENGCVGKRGWCVVSDPHHRRTRRPSSTTLAPEQLDNQRGNSELSGVVNTGESENIDDLQLRDKRESESKVQKTKLYQKEHKDRGSHLVETTDAANAANRIYLLPEFKPDRIIVRIPEAYQLKDFHSISIFNRCKEVRLAKLKVDHIHPPGEVDLGSISSGTQQFPIHADRIRILDCNSILLNNFTFNAQGKTDIYFYVGIDNNPFNTSTTKLKAHVVGQQGSSAMRNYTKEDILVRLPPGTRTMDITWLAIASQSGVVYARITIPPVAVPPCQ